MRNGAGTMNEALQQALIDKLLAMADDELILGHRNSEWTGHAPILEEDIAFANIAQDEIGHAALWLNLYQEWTGNEPDQVVFFRDPAAFRNIRLVELPRGDWAFTMTRQYLFDVFELVRLAQLTNSTYQPLAEVAAKVRPEELYHYRHTHTWVKRLGLGTAESNQRMQAALNELWPYAQQLFQPTPGEHLLVEAGYVPDPAGLHTAWTETVAPFLRQCDLVVPDSPAAEQDGRDVHTPHLEQLVNELQEVARLDPQAQW